MRCVCSRLLPAVSLLMILVSSSARAGIAPLASGGRQIRFDQTFQTVLTVYQEGRQHYLIQVGYSVRDTGVTSVPRLAWVMAMPEASKRLGVRSDSAIVAVWNWASRMSTRPNPASRPRLPFDETSAPAEITSSWVEGNYSVRVFPGQRELRTWLSGNGYGALPAGPVEALHNAGWVFVAIEVLPDSSSAGLPISGVLRPLRGSFMTDRVLFPVQLSRENGQFHLFAFVLSAGHLNVADAEAFGMKPARARAVRTRYDSLLWHAAVSESSRATVWDRFDAYSTPAKSVDVSADTSIVRDRQVEWQGSWLASMTSGWTESIVNRMTGFPKPKASSGSALDRFFAVAASENLGYAPPDLVRFYRSSVSASGTIPLDSLYVSVFCAPGVNLPGTQTDLHRWIADPQIRAMPAGVRKIPALPTVTDVKVRTGYHSPRRALLPLPEGLETAIRQLKCAVDAADIARSAAQVITKGRTYPPVRFLRQLSLSGVADSILAMPELPSAMDWPENDPRITNRRSMQAFERAFRGVMSPLRAIHVAANARTHAGSSVMLFTMEVSEKGVVTDVEVSGDLPKAWLQVACRVAKQVRLHHADEDGQYDFLVVVGE
jgi:hypothetical protein